MVLNLLIAINESEITNKTAPTVNPFDTEFSTLSLIFIAAINMIEMIQLYITTGIKKSPGISGHKKWINEIK